MSENTQSDLIRLSDWHHLGPAIRQHIDQATTNQGLTL